MEGGVDVMKASAFLLMALLSSMLLNSAYLVGGTLDNDHLTTSAARLAYTAYGTLSLYDVDYWWIPNINGAEVILASIVQDETVCYESWLCFSNLTVLQDRWCSGTHNHDFVAPEAGSYLLKIHAAYGGFNYTIYCDHPVREEPMQTVHGSLSQGEEYNYWIPSIAKDQVFLMSTFQDEAVCYESLLYYSNLTELQERWCSGTHNHDFVADKTDTYLLKIKATYGGLNYTIKHSSRALPTGITFSVDPNPALVGQTVNLLGRLSELNSHQPIPNQAIKLSVNGTQSGTLMTNATGWFKGSGQVQSVGAFNVTVSYLGSMQYLPCSSWTMLIVKKTQTWLYATFNPNPVNPGKSCELRGILVDQFSNPMKSTTVNLEYSTDYGSTWHPAGTLVTDLYGTLSKTLTAPSLGTYLVRISYAGSPSHGPSRTVEPLIVR
jgi:hypothetical protein